MTLFERWNGKSFLIGTAIFALYLITYSLAWPQAPVSTYDTRTYMEMARELAGFELRTPTIRTPGYPLLLVLTGSTQKPTRLLFFTGLIFHFIASAAIALILMKCGVRRFWALSIFAFLLLPLYTQAAGFALTENLTEFMLVMAFLCVVSGWRDNSTLLMAIGSFLLACTALVRPTYQLLVFATIATVWLVYALTEPRKALRGRTVKLSIMAVIAAITLFGAYGAYYNSRFGYFGLSYGAGINLCDKTARFVERTPVRFEPLRSLLIEYRDKSLVQGQSHTAEQYPWNNWTDLTARSQMSEVALARQLAAINRSLIISNPLTYLESVGHSVVGLLFPQTTVLSAGRSSLLQLLWSAVHFLIFALFLLQVWVVAGQEVWLFSARWLRRGEQEWTPDYGLRIAYFLSLSFVVYTILISALADTGNPRFRSPVDALVVLNTALGIQMWFSRIAFQRHTAVQKELAVSV